MSGNSLIGLSLIAFASHRFASCCSLSASFTDVALSMSKSDRGCGMGGIFLCCAGGLSCSVFFNLSLISRPAVFLFVIRGTFMVAVTEFAPTSGSVLRPFSRRFVSELIEFVLDFGGGEIVKVAEIFSSSSLSSFSTLERSVFLKGELIV